jgi:putative ABC transport system ATP-binding protein
LAKYQFVLYYFLNENMNTTEREIDTIWLETKALCRHYQLGSQKIKAVDSVDIMIPKGEFLSVVGASGSGKSTLLGLLAGLDTPTSGQIIADGLSLSSLSRRELAAYRAQKVGMVFQSFNLIHHHTAQKNVELALYFSTASDQPRKTRAREMLERLGLGDRLNHRPADLSGGEQQRVAIARALVKQPAILFADEPTGNLDYENSRHIANLLIDLNRQGLTIVLATHDLEIAQSSAHRIIRMHYGKITDEIKNPSGKREPQ